MSDQRFKDLFTRYKNNPIIQTKDIPYQANSVFNAGATRIGDEILLLMRVEDRRGISHLTVARSKDGVTDWRIDETPTLLPCPEKYPEEIWGIEDPRITRIESLDLWAVVYTSYSRGGPLVSLATTKDFKNFERKGVVMPPEDKDAALFPVRFKGRWAMLHRPVSGFVGIGSHIWISFSPDMKHWGDHQILIPARRGGWWDANKIGLSPPPLQTDKGWLILYHGVRNTPSGCIYRLGLALLDLRDPTRVLARSDEWVFSPEEDYEVVGDVDKVVFPCGWVAEGDLVRLYYGGADKCIAMATARISEMLEWLEEHSHQGIKIENQDDQKISSSTVDEDQRPWGYYEVLSETPSSKVKQITIYPGQRLSYQRHSHRSEHWYIISGNAVVIKDRQEIVLKPGEGVDIPVNTWHRISNPGTENTVLIEVQTGDYFGEDDIERAEDDYGRV